MLGAHLNPQQYLARCAEEFGRLDLSQTAGLADEIYSAYQDGRFVFICGNGGSGSNSSHFCEDLGKSTLRREDFTNDSVKRLKVLSLTDNTPYILAWGNDEGFDRVFLEQLKNLAGDAAHARTLDDLRGRLKEWQTQTKDPWVVKYTYE